MAGLSVGREKKILASSSLLEFGKTIWFEKNALKSRNNNPIFIFAASSNDPPNPPPGSWNNNSVFIFPPWKIFCKPVDGILNFKS